MSEIYNIILPVYVINLKEREERLIHILKEFDDVKKFNITIIQSYKNDKANVDLWNNVKKCIKAGIEEDHDFIIVCEDDHAFTDAYSYQYLLECIQEARNKDAEILCGGVSWFKTGVQISENLFWVESFTGLQFTIIFKNIFHKILTSEFSIDDFADLKITELCSNKFIIHPFISTQKEFGYSDVTARNDGTDRVELLFTKASQTLELLKKVRNFYLDNSIVDNNLLQL